MSRSGKESKQWGHYGSVIQLTQLEIGPCKAQWLGAQVLEDFLDLNPGFTT